MKDEVIFTEDNGVGVITLNRPDRLNALTYSMVQKVLYLEDLQVIFLQ